ncbi:hypothetical protein Ocin01_02936 [Orchesella cincta]|uniref:C2H2-type domain-containing protein n=1 Tax=Orchesella cincta TaxID=48709 RepID=A0A1D2NEQ5_ORCCI|nr:hypothetical protein Ocin01_02936 [Orchesella cincta]
MLLEVRGTHFNDIYRTVKMMNITILIKLLEAHSRKPAPTQVKKEAGRSVVLKQAVDLGKGQKGQVQIQVATGQHQSASPIMAVPGSKALQVAAPGVKLPPGVKTKTVLARVQPQTSKSPSQAAGKSTPKKLPIWKERKFTTVNQDPPQLEKWQIKEEEPARPTRFEWGDPDEPDPFLSSTLTNHALMEKQKEKHSSRKAEDIFDSVKSQTQSQQGIKRPQPGSSSTASPSADPPAAKIPKLDVVTAVSSEVIIPDTSSDTLNSINLNENTVIEEVTTSAPETKPVEKKPIPILKPALKTAAPRILKGAGTSDKGASGSGKDNSPQKTVRFAPEVEKENKEKPAMTATTTTAQAAQVTTSKVEIPISSFDGGDQSINHSKIISEVLRKFPDLVKDNKNIKLKIVQKPVDNSSPSSSKETKSKVSYIVLKSTGGSDSTASTVLKKSPAQTSVSKFWETDKTPKKPSPAENTTGPWLCETCGEGENTALQFDTYYNFRRHLVDVHGERIDARICEYCGQKASKRNLLLYHMYTKHGVQPPKNCTFPHCDRCDYVALSESLLNKHKQNHDVNKEFCCSICNASFKSSVALQGHMSANLHRNKDTKVYECPYCRKPFVRNINLKAHIRSLHRDVARYEEMEDPRLPPDESLTHRIVATSSSKKRQFPSILAAARGSSNTNLVEFLTADNLHDGQTVSYVTADGQPIEIIDPSQLSSLPLTLVSSGEDGIATVSSPMGSSIGLEGQSAAGTEYVTGVAQDGSQAVYVMDGSQGAVEIDMANMGLTLSADGTMLYEGDDSSQNFIVQDMQGNQFRRMTGIDETGKPVVFLQMMGEGEQVAMSPVVLDESMTVDETAGSSQMFVSSSGMTIPVTSDGTSGQQVIFASTSEDGTILEMVPADSGSHQVVMSEAELSAHGQHNEQEQHLQLVDHGQSSENMQEVIHDEMGQPVQELHIVLDGQESSRHEGQEQSQQEVLDIVEVRQTEEYITDSTHAELQLGEAYTHSVIEHEHMNENESGAGATDTSVEEIHEHDDVMTQEITETQQIEIDEGDSNQLQIHEETHTMEECETQEMEVDSQETQIVTTDNLQESIELVEGQTLTLIEEEDGTQTIKVDNSNVEEITS